MDWIVSQSIQLTPQGFYQRQLLLGRIRAYVEPALSNLLEIGAGDGRYGALFGREFARYVGIDPAFEVLVRAAAKTPGDSGPSYVCAVAEQLPFERMFDVLFFAQSWHMLQDHEAAVGEARRVLSPGGMVLIVEPTEHTTFWADPVLRRDSPDFVQSAYDRKIRRLAAADTLIGKLPGFRLEEQFADRFSRLKISSLVRAPEDTGVEQTPKQ